MTTYSVILGIQSISMKTVKVDTTEDTNTKTMNQKTSGTKDSVKEALRSLCGQPDTRDDWNSADNPVASCYKGGTR